MKVYRGPNASTNQPMYWSGVLQGWLQGDMGRKPRCVWLGNLLSDVRFWLWRARPAQRRSRDR